MIYFALFSGMLLDRQCTALITISMDKTKQPLSIITWNHKKKHFTWK